MAAKDISTAYARFVSMDTHPANSSLVITYEVPIIATDPKTGRELLQGSKRDQFHVNIPALDKLTKDDLERAQGAVPFDMRQLSEEIMKQYPLLSDEGDPAKILENIQLNILYLFNRKRGQLYQPSTIKPSRPPSSTGSSRLASARAGSARARASGKNEVATKTSGNHPMDIYSQLCAKHLELTSKHADHYDLLTLDEFAQQMDAHLEETELKFQVDQDPLGNGDLESQLEGLYGDQDERKRSMANIRRFIRESEKKLAGASSNRLLVCAMLRILRDCDGTRDHYLSKSILYCIIRFTSSQDSIEHMPSQGKTAIGGSGDWPELVRVVMDLLEKQTQWLNRCDDLRQIVPYYTNALMAVLTNLMQEKEGDQNNQVKKLVVLQYGNTLADILVGMLETLAKHVARYLRAPNEHYERLVLTLRLTLGAILRLVIFKEFVLLLRANSRALTLVNSTVSLLNTLQLCRPGSGTVQQQQHQMLVSDQATLLDVYELELELLKLVTYLTYDTRLKARLMRKSLLLKCVLRNLVVFLAASRKSNTLSPFDRSPVLMIPFRCLYELSCSDKIKHELFRSKIIMKCLLEYLLSAATDLAAELDGASRPRGPVGNAHRTNLDLHEDEQIVLEPQNVSHYIVAFWLNLSARNVAPIYHLAEGNEELREPICDYLQLIAGNLLTFMGLVESQSSRTGPQPTRALHLNIYVHAKLLRNLSQFFEHFESSDGLLRSLSQSSHLMLAQVQAGRFEEFTPLAVESLAVLANFIGSQQVSSSPDDDCRLYLETLLEQLFGERGLFVRGLAESENEYDDLLLVAINLFGAMAQNREICAEIKSIYSGLLNVMNATLELKQTDTEMLISCLFTLRQLMNHSSFLQELGQSLDRLSDAQQQQQQALTLIDNLSLLIMHPDTSVVKLANSILNMLKQFEELYSLSQSITCQRRFAAYNSKWLGAIKANRDDPPDSLAGMQLKGGAMPIQGLEGREEDETNRQLETNEDYNQLRTIHEIETHSSSSSSRLSTGNSQATKLNRRDNKIGDDKEDEADNKFDSGEEEEEEDGEDDEEETFSEPDLNVIDANSMIKHLTNRREFRAELMRR